MKRIFSLQTDLVSYGYPLIKLVVSVLIILFSIYRNKFLCITIKPLNFLVVFICFAATIASVLCIYISIGELFYIRKNRRA